MAFWSSSLNHPWKMAKRKQEGLVSIWERENKVDRKFPHADQTILVIIAALKLKVNKSAAQKKKLEDYFKPGGRLEYKYFGRNPDVSAPPDSRPDIAGTVLSSILLTFSQVSDPVQSRKKAIDSARGSGTAEVTTTKQQEEKTIDS